MSRRTANQGPEITGPRMEQLTQGRGGANAARSCPERPVLNRGGLFGAQLPKPDLADVFLAHASHLRLVLLERVPGVARLG